VIDGHSHEFRDALFCMIWSPSVLQFLQNKSTAIFLIQRVSIPFCALRCVSYVRCRCSLYIQIIL
jgi:hypothetical protein